MDSAVREADCEGGPVYSKPRFLCIVSHFLGQIRQKCKRFWGKAQFWLQWCVELGCLDERNLASMNNNYVQCSTITTPTSSSSSLSLWMLQLYPCSGSEASKVMVCGKSSAHLCLAQQWTLNYGKFCSSHFWENGNLLELVCNCSRREYMNTCLNSHTEKKKTTWRKIRKQNGHTSIPEVHGGWIHIQSLHLCKIPVGLAWQVVSYWSQKASCTPIPNNLSTAAHIYILFLEMGMRCDIMIHVV